MPVKRIADDIWERMKGWAVPLDDGVDDVLRRLLDIADEHRKCQAPNQSVTDHIMQKSPTRTKRVARGASLSEEAYKLPILDALRGLGGAAKVESVLTVVDRKVRGRTDFDYQRLPKSGEVRWRNRAKWARKRLIEDGLLKSDSPHGFWELTSEG